VKSEPETKEDVEEQGVSDAKEVPTEEESNQYTFEEYLDAVRKAEEEQQQRETLQREVERLRDVVAEVIKPTTSKSVEEEMYFKEVSNGMGENEEGFNDETPLLQRNYWWHDKYRPRKPKYFNRIRTGYEWNKYNQTHYDHDNPPPKVVQGYKFNIFYPDLIDPTKAPQYFIEKASSPDYVILRFHAGPPYEDIAFTIVNREWEYSHKKGFKCNFEKGILHLWFNFRRYRYRR